METITFLELSKEISNCGLKENWGLEGSSKELHHMRMTMTKGIEVMENDRKYSSMTMKSYPEVIFKETPLTREIISLMKRLPLPNWLNSPNNSKSEDNSMGHLTIRPISMIRGLLAGKKKQLCLRIRYFQMENSRILRHTPVTTFKMLSKRMFFTVLRASLKWLGVPSMQTLVMVLITSRRKVKPGKRQSLIQVTTSFLKESSQAIVLMAITTFKIRLRGESRSIQSPTWEWVVNLKATQIMRKIMMEGQVHPNI